jgi:hypothetical protein
MAKEQPIPPDALASDDAVEVLRAFVVQGGLSIAFTRAFDDPGMWGMMLVDIARHAARAFAKEGVMSEDEALAKITEMFSAELADVTDIGRTMTRDKQGH